MVAAEHVRYLREVWYWAGHPAGLDTCDDVDGYSLLQMGQADTAAFRRRKLSSRHSAIRASMGANSVLCRAHLQVAEIPTDAKHVTEVRPPQSKKLFGCMRASRSIRVTTQA